ncbi:hypothetical protein ACIRRH_30160 [Kitasatospora sp. NPDC101235]|uniref:hypothetical protein n=1 Tax=Kitasatospora sp. NPDC101235 TaxID=3364101 RepID=UPI00380DD560
MSAPPHRRAARSARPAARPRVRIHARVRATRVAPPVPRVAPWRPYAVLVAILLFCAAGLLLYLDERSSRG